MTTPLMTGTIVRFPSQEPKTDDDKAREAMEKLEYLKSIRIDYETMLENIFTYVYPGRRKIEDKDAQKGQKTGMEVYDNTALFSLNTLVDGMIGYLCSHNQRWFRFTIPGKFNFARSSGMRGWTGRPIESYPQVRQWLEDCEDQQYAAFNRSNFYDQMPEFLRDGAGAGTAHMLIEEDVASGRVMCVVPHYREYYIAEDQFGRVDTAYRVYKLTLRQMEQKFGADALAAVDQGFLDNLKTNPYQERELLHAVEPRQDADENSYDIRKAKIASLWVDVAKKKLLMESGYRWMPSVSWRWRKNNDEIYGRSPAWDAIIDILIANEQGRSNLIGGHKMVEPPMSAPKHLRTLVNTGPKSWTYVENEAELKMITPLMTVQNLPFAVQCQERTAQNIRNHFGAPFFDVLTQAAMQKVELTATQVIEITGERAAILSTRVGMLESEALNPIQDRFFEIECRAGRMPMPPDILWALMKPHMEVQYMGVLSQVQQLLTKVKEIQTGLGLIAQVAQYWAPAMDRIDGDKLVDEIVKFTNFPMTCISSNERTTEIRKQRAQMQQKQQEIAAMPAYAKLLRAAGPKPEPGSPAQKLLNPEESEEGEGAAPAPMPGATPGIGA